MTSNNDDFARLPHAQKKAANRPVDTHNFKPTYFPRTIWSERGIDVGELKTTDIPHKIRVHRWGNFVFPRLHYHPDIVEDFYASLIPEVFMETGMVFVRGCEVVITAKLINEYFSIRTLDAPKNFFGGINRQEFFAQVDAGFASELRWDKSNESRDLLYTELHPEMALWTLFINHNLMPSKIQTVLSLEMTQVLFSINKALPIDVGQIIHKQICYALSSASTLLPFPSLITHFCRISGVTIRNNLLCAPLEDIGRESYNDFAQQQGLPTLPLRKQGVEPLPLQLPGGNADRPKWVNEITGRLNSLSDMMVGQHNALSTQINNLGMRVTSLEDAVRDAGFEHLHCRSVRPRLAE